jgi:vacuolar-type H+-ATPase subunit F/Vma7
MTYKPTVLVDFDGVIHRYSMGWHDGTAYDEPMPAAKEALKAMTERGYEVVIFSTREWKQIRDWLNLYGFNFYRITNVKIPAVAQIDDRAIRFENWPQSIDDLFRLYPAKKEQP